MAPPQAPLPLIIEAALNGETTRAVNRHVPRHPSEIAADGVECLAAGAAIVHNHNDDPNVGGTTGRHDPAPYAEAWRTILAHDGDAILYATMAGGGAHTTAAERASHAVALAELGLARMAVVDPGSVNVAPVTADGTPAPSTQLYVTTCADVHAFFALCRQHRLGPSLAIYEPGFLRVVLAFWRAGQLPDGALVKLFFTADGYPWGLPPTAASLDAYLAMLEGTDLPWSVALIGGDVIGSGIARLALHRGGHLRVGLEDFRGGREPRNEELVRDAAALASDVGRPVAGPPVAASLLGLPSAPAVRN